MRADRVGGMNEQVMQGSTAVGPGVPARSGFPPRMGRCRADLTCADSGPLDRFDKGSAEGPGKGSAEGSAEGSAKGKANA
jgi:hypothetical protein